jgi:purine-cytosine permease-like protein
MSGIEPIPKEERNLGGWDFFLLWAGAAISLAEIWAGGLMVPLGLGLGPNDGQCPTLFRNQGFLLCCWS